MPRSTISPKSPSRSGTLTFTFTTANSTDNHEFDNSTGRNYLYIQNDSAGSFTATIPVSGTIDGLTIPDNTVVVAAGACAIFGPFPRGGIYSQTSEKIHVNASATSADVKLAVIRN